MLLTSFIHGCLVSLKVENLAYASKTQWLPKWSVNLREFVSRLDSLTERLQIFLHMNASLLNSISMTVCPDGWLMVEDFCIRMVSQSFSDGGCDNMDTSQRTCMALNACVARLSNSGIQTLKKLLKLWNHRDTDGNVLLRNDSQSGACLILEVSPADCT